MRYVIRLLTICLVLAPFPAQADKPAACLTADCGVSLMPLRSSLIEWGTSNFTWWGFSVYGAKLYLPDAARQQNPISVRPKILELTYARDFSREDFQNSGEEILKDNPGVDVSAPAVRSCLDQLAQLYKPVQESDTYSIVHTPSGQIELWLNDELVGRACSEVGSRAYFSIWLSAEHSIGNSFQQKLLGTRAAAAFFDTSGAADAQ